MEAVDDTGRSRPAAAPVLSMTSCRQDQMSRSRRAEAVRLRNTSKSAPVSNYKSPLVRSIRGKSGVSRLMDEESPRSPANLSDDVQPSRLLRGPTRFQLHERLPMLLARDGRPLHRRVVAVAVAALMATAASPGAWQTPAADAGKPDVTTLAWGDNGSGQLGDGTTIHRSTPVSVCAPGRTAPCTRFLTDVVDIAAGTSHSLALRKDGTVLAWGNNGGGQLGDGTSTNRRTPVRVCAPGQTAPCTQFLTHVHTITAHGGHSLALRKDDTVVAWGTNGFGQLGDGTTVNRRTPVRVCAPGQTAPCTQFLTHVHTIGAGRTHSLALRDGGAALAWGNNGAGQLGDGTTTNRRTPVPVCAPGQTAPCTRFLTHVSTITAGGRHSLALAKDAALAWGNNDLGQLGDGTTTDRNTPVRVCAPGQTAPCTRFLTHVHTIDGGGQHSLALVDDQRPRHWFVP